LEATLCLSLGSLQLIICSSYQDVAAFCYVEFVHME